MASTIRRGLAIGMVMLASPFAALAVEPLAEEAVHAPLHEVTLSDGQRLRGRVETSSDGTYRLSLADGERLDLPAATVRSFRELQVSEGGVWGLDPNRSRYLYSPAAFPLGKGNGYVAQRAIVITSAGIGVSPIFDMEVGLILPALFTGSGLAVIGGKFSVELADSLRIGGGTQVFWVDTNLAGFAFGNVTFGDPDRHLTIAGGLAGNTELRTQPAVVELAAFVGTLSGSWRLGPGMSLISENWIVWFNRGNGPWNIPLFIVPSGGVRLFGPQFSVDLALVPIVTGEREIPLVPIPWVSFAWAWEKS